MQFFSLQQHSHSVSSYRSESSVVNPRAPCGAAGMPGEHCLDREKLSKPGSADATNCICLKIGKSMPGEAKAFRSADSWDFTVSLLAFCAFLAGC